MHIPVLRSIASLAVTLLAGHVVAQTTFPLAATNTFHRVNSDPGATIAYSLPIGAFGVTPGAWLKLRCVGDWNNGVSGDVLKDMVGCFTATGVLLADNLQQRLPQPIAAGPAYVSTTGTAIGNLPIDIAEDFWISRTGFVSEVTVKIPPGTVHLFLCVPDSFYSDNTDPDGDLGLEVSVVSPPAHAGTAEDSELGSAINTAPLDTFDTKSAVAGNVIHAAVRSPLDTQANLLCVIVADVQATGTTPVGPLPNTWFGLSAVIALPFALLPSGAQGPQLNITVPPGFAGLSLWLQGGTVWPTGARNGLFTATNAHEIRLL